MKDYPKDYPKELKIGDNCSENSDLAKFFKERNWEYTWYFDNKDYWYEILYNNKTIMQIEFEVTPEDLLKTIKKNVPQFNEKIMDKSSLICINEYADGCNFYIWPSGKKPKYNLS